MNNKAQTGQDGEQAAVEYLRKKGFIVLERNYRYRKSEIDIIVKKEKLLVFVEVKTKSHSAFAHPEEAVNRHKIKKILQGANHYIHFIDWQHDVRFDVIAIDNSIDEMIHFEDAFY